MAARRAITRAQIQCHRLRAAVEDTQFAGIGGAVSGGESLPVRFGATLATVSYGYLVAS